MDIKKAEVIFEIVKKLEATRNQLKLFNQTSEFCRITIFGEDGAESDHDILFTYKSNPSLVAEVRKLISDTLNIQITELQLRIEEE